MHALPEPLRQHPRDDVGRRRGAEADDDTDRAGRIGILRGGGQGGQQESREQVYSMH